MAKNTTTHEARLLSNKGSKGTKGMLVPASQKIDNLLDIVPVIDLQSPVLTPEPLIAVPVTTLAPAVATTTPKVFKVKRLLPPFRLYANSGFRDFSVCAPGSWNVLSYLLINAAMKQFVVANKDKSPNPGFEPISELLIENFQIVFSKPNDWNCKQSSVNGVVDNAGKIIIPATDNRVLGKKNTHIGFQGLQINTRPSNFFSMVETKLDLYGQGAVIGFDEKGRVTYTGYSKA